MERCRLLYIYYMLRGGIMDLPLFFFLMRHAILRAPTIPTQHVVRSLSAWTIYLRGHMYISYLTIGVT